MIDSNLRNPYQRLIITPLLKWGIVTRISPNMFTLCGTVTGLIIPLCLYFQSSFWALFFLGFSGFFDTLDGSLARHLGKVTPKGAVLDITSDRFVEFAIILGLYFQAPEGRGLILLGMLGAIFLCVTTFLVVGIFQENSSEKSFHYSPGLIERGEAFIFFALMILFPSIFAPLALLFIGLTFLTAYRRIYQFIKN